MTTHAQAELPRYRENLGARGTNRADISVALTALSQMLQAIALRIAPKCFCGKPWFLPPG
jgi:hypothetical protein